MDTKAAVLRLCLDRKKIIKPPGAVVLPRQWTPGKKCKVVWTCHCTHFSIKLRCVTIKYSFHYKHSFVVLLGCPILTLKIMLSRNKRMCFFETDPNKYHPQCIFSNKMQYLHTVQPYRISTFYLEIVVMPVTDITFTQTKTSLQGHEFIFKPAFLDCLSLCHQYLKQPARPPTLPAGGTRIKMASVVGFACL